MIEIIAIGNELLSGNTVNTNSSEIGLALQAVGFTNQKVTTIPDEEDIIETEMLGALARSKFVITTGGLGLTLDDKTLDVCKKAFGPQKRDLKNSVGQVCGALFEKGDSFLLALPGVPAEMRSMLKEEVIPFILQNYGEKKKSVRHFHLFHMVEKQIDPFLRETSDAIECGIYPAYGTVSVTFKSTDEKELDNVAKTFSEKYGSYIYSTGDKRIELALHEKMIEEKKTLGLAESCTGGMIAARLCQIPNASDYFLGGVVSYSDPVKEKLLFANSVETKGAVSREVACEMAQGALKQVESDFAIAVTGIAGPDGGSDEKPIGTVWASIASKNENFTGLLPIRGRKQRPSIIEYTGTYTLGLLWRWLKHGAVPFEETK